MKDVETKFRVKDPLGRNVVLKNDTWTNHIKEKHGECCEEEIKENIQNPCYIIKNIKPIEDGNTKLIVDETRNDYVRLTIKKDRLYVQKTIVDYSNSECGIVVTNHILRNAREIKTTGGVIYDRSKDSGSTELTGI